MKVHEFAKSLGIKTGELIDVLRERGLEVKGPGQHLTEEEMALYAEPKVRIEKGLLYSNKTVRIVIVEDNKVVEILDEKTFVNEPQAFAFMEYELAKLEL